MLVFPTMYRTGARVEKTQIGSQITVSRSVSRHYKTLSLYGNDDTSVAPAVNTVRSASGTEYTEAAISSGSPLYGLKCSINRYKMSAATIRSASNGWSWTDDHTATAYGLTIVIDENTGTIRLTGTKNSSSSIYLDLSRTRLTPEPVGIWGADTAQAYIYDAAVERVYPKINYGYNSSNYSWSYYLGGSAGDVYDYTLSPMFFTADDSTDFDGTFEAYTGAFPGDANFTDENGVKWCADSIDFVYADSTGVCTKRVGYDQSTGELSVLATPVTSAMSAEEIAAFKDLSIYPTATQLTNTAGHKMKITYDARER